VDLLKSVVCVCMLVLPLVLGGCGGESSGEEAPPITDAAVVRNDQIDLTCFVTWTTPEPATSAVQFGEAADGASPSYDRVVEDATLKTEHRMLVVGMHASTPYRLRAVSIGASGKSYASGDLGYTTGDLPAHLRDATLVSHDVAQTFDGWTAMTLAAAEMDPSGGIPTVDPTFPTTGVVYDMDGKILWYSVHQLSFNGRADYLPDGTLLFTSQNFIFATPTPSARRMDLEGNTVWEGPAQPVGVLADGIYHHDFHPMPNGNWLTLRALLQNSIVGDYILELDDAGNELWRWSAFDHLTPDTTGWNGTGYFDWTHFNSVEYQADDDTVLVNSRLLDAFYKIDRASGEVLWTFGQEGDFTVTSPNDAPWFLKAHALERLPSGDLILLDNGQLGVRDWSRVIVYRLDEAARTATIVWEYRGELPWAAYYWGDADRLPNENILVSAGNADPGRTSTVFEVTPAEQKVWELALWTHNDHTVGMYNASRFPALAKPLVR
jgi:arylsulfate sulfotransferase